MINTHLKVLAVCWALYTHTRAQCSLPSFPLFLNSPTSEEFCYCPISQRGKQRHSSGSLATEGVEPEPSVLSDSKIYTPTRTGLPVASTFWVSVIYFLHVHHHFQTSSTFLPLPPIPQTPAWLLSSELMVVDRWDDIWVTSHSELAKVSSSKPNSEIEPIRGCHSLTPPKAVRLFLLVRHFCGSLLSPHPSLRCVSK